MRMRVAMVGWEYARSTTGGLGTHCNALVPELRARGVDVTLFVPTTEDDALSAKADPDVRAVPLAAGLDPYGSAARSVPPTLEAVEAMQSGVLDSADAWGGRPELVHAHDWLGVPAGIALAERFRCPLVVTIHSTERDRAAGMPLHPLRSAIEQRGIALADAVIAVSERTKRDVCGSLGADPAKVSVIYNGIVPEQFAPPRPRDYEAEAPSVLYLGRLARQKAPDAFLHAAKRVAAARAASFVLAGDGELRSRLLVQARRLGLNGQVKFPGRVPEEALARAYQSASIYALPSRSEPFGITVLEAMAAGTPCIVSSAAGVTECVRAVMLVEPGDAPALAAAIVRLLDDAALRRRLGERGRAEAATLTWSAVAARTQAVYQWAVGADGAPAPSWQLGVATP